MSAVYQWRSRAPSTSTPAASDLRPNAGAKPESELLAHGLPYVHQLQMPIFTDPQTMVTALESGGLDAAVNVPLGDASRLAGSSPACCSADSSLGTGDHNPEAERRTGIIALGFRVMARLLSRTRGRHSPRV